MYEIALLVDDFTERVHVINSPKLVIFSRILKLQITLNAIL